MEYATIAKNASAAAQIGGTTKYISLHTADPAGTGASEVTGGSYARVATTWGAVAAGSVTGSAVTINVPSGVTVYGWGVWDAATGGNYWEGNLLGTPYAFTQNGTLLLTPTVGATG
jgi:hypothetical protein